MISKTLLRFENECSINISEPLSLELSGSFADLIGCVYSPPRIYASSLTLKYLPKRVVPGDFFFKLVGVTSTGDNCSWTSVAAVVQVYATLLLSTHTEGTTDTPLLPFTCLPSVEFGCVVVSVSVPPSTPIGSYVLIHRISVAGCEITMTESPARVAIDFNHAPARKGAVYESAEVGDVLRLESALRSGGSTEEMLSFGETAIMYPCRDGHLDAVRTLIKAGANVNAKNKRMWTPLHYAAMNGNGPLTIGQTAIVQALLDAGADVTARDIWGRTAADYAPSNECSDMAEVLRVAAANMAAA